MSKVDSSLFDSLVRVAASRGQIVTRLDEGGLDISFRLPRDLVNEEILQAIVQSYARRFGGK